MSDRSSSAKVVFDWLGYLAVFVAVVQLLASGPSLSRPEWGVVIFLTVHAIALFCAAALTHHCIALGGARPWARMVFSWFVGATLGMALVRDQQYSEIFGEAALSNPTLANAVSSQGIQMMGWLCLGATFVMCLLAWRLPGGHKRPWSEQMWDHITCDRVDFD